MRILLSNDDGCMAPGLLCLAEHLRRKYSVEIVAPDRNRSAASNSLTILNPLRIQRHADGTICVDGTPTDCVHLALTGLLEGLPDMVVSGINNGPNLGDDTLYSGTVAAAMEGYLFGIPSIAFSLSEKGWQHLDTAARVARSLLEQVLAEPPGAPPWLLNVNIPARPLGALAGRVTTRLGRRHASEPVIRQSNPRGEPIYWIGAAGDAREAGEGTDFHATANGCVSITPLQVDLTDHARLPDWRSRLESPA